MSSILLSEFDSRLESIHGKIFSGRPFNSEPYVNVQWRKILIPYGVAMDKRYFSALESAARSVGDQCYVLTDEDSPDPHSYTWEIPWNFDSFQDVVYKEPTRMFKHWESSMFGESASWGVYMMTDEVGFFSGIDGVISEFKRAFGEVDLGTERLDFLQHSIRFFGEQWVEWLDTSTSL